MSVIYEPKGKAGEYSPLACNLYEGCIHSCKYCYAPGVRHVKRSVFHIDNQPREDILDRLEKDCKKLRKDPREILLCFTCDPYQPFIFHSDDITRQALLILEKYEMKVTVLTKGGMRAARDFNLLKANDWSFGTTLSMVNKGMRLQWEPNAASITDRVEAIQKAHKMGIKTWVSVEPVVECGEALRAIELISPWVDHFKIGKMNYHKYIEERENWPLFLEAVEQLLSGRDYYIKQDLLKAAGRELDGQVWDGWPGE